MQNKEINRLVIKLSDTPSVSPDLAKKIIDALNSRQMDMEFLPNVIDELEEAISDQAIMDKLNSSSAQDIMNAINEVINDCICQGMYANNMTKEVFVLSEINSENFSESSSYELITTAKQTDSRYGDFSYSKADLETMANNFNENVVGTEIPVDLNHDPEHIAYAWIKPGSMEVRESTALPGQFSLYAQLYRFTPEGKDIVSTGKIRYFSLQIQNKFDKFVDKTKKTYNLVIRALALTNMPVIKDMAPTFNEDILLDNHTKTMEREAELEKQLSDNQAANAILLSEKDMENKRLSEELAKVHQEKRDISLAEEVEKLCLSENQNIAFKGGEKAGILAFVKTLSDDQAKAYFTLHTAIITGVDLGEHGTQTGDGTKDYEEIASIRAKALAKAEGISLSTAYTRVLSEDKELADNVA